ncbi:minor capsid protein [Bacillus sp. FSL K6-3431]|uniref:minor capsid protein n=1 Tax=Bacillus sp. FSL K6-3431 TaxID=2921500 RepID=UPI0030F5B66D
MAIKVKFKSDLDGVKRKASDMVKQGQYAFANQVLADSNIYAPMLSSDLRNQSSIALDGKSIIWNAPYARRQYYNYGAKFTTPGTGPKWDVKAQAIHGASWQEIVKKAMK